MSERKCLEATVMHRRRAVADSDNSSSEYDKDLLPVSKTNYCKNCCSCTRTQRSKSKSKERKVLQNEPQPAKTTFREQLEMKVLNDELSEQMSHDTYQGTKRQYDEVSDMLSALAVFLQCLDMKTKALQRLQSLLTDGDSIQQELFDQISIKLAEINRLAADGVGQNVAEELEAYTSKHSDFLRASSNFANILHNSTRVSNQQLKKLESQFDSIRSEYNQAKTTVDSKLNDLVQTKAELINKCFQRLLPVLINSSELEKQLLGSISDISVEVIKRKTESARSLNIVSKNAGHTDEARRKSCTCLESVH